MKSIQLLDPNWLRTVFMSRGAETYQLVAFFVDVDLCDLWRCGREDLKPTNELRFFFTDAVLCDLRRCGRE